ncbi:MAG: hypothetical protein MK329_16430 [Pirellulales bacterium]|jgi:hypothetical protein|nr:hypothetical protein [Pirellulales bacterium]
MAINVATGNGATLTFSGFTGNVTTISGAEMEIEAIETSHLGTTGYREYIPGSLKEGGELEVEFIFTGDMVDLGDAGTVTVTYPKTNSGSSSGATLSGSAFVQNLSYPEATNGEALAASVTFKFDGDTDPTFSAEA